MHKIVGFHVAKTHQFFGDQFSIPATPSAESLSGLDRTQLLFIANRGEIACRAMRTAHGLLFKNVLVIYEASDRNARHVEMARELGYTVKEVSKYTDIATVLGVIPEGQKAHIFPGYGFLSENPQFVQQCEQRGHVFLGPRADNIETFGDKGATKVFAKSVGVACVPGIEKEGGVSLEEVKAFIAVNGPSIVKAVAGGGGRGARVIRSVEDVETLFAEAQNEARILYNGNDKLLVEKFIENPRHLEVQILGDGTAAVSLGGRECSAQSRHQKVIEVGNPPISSALKAEMEASALKLANGCGYRGAGTVEFLLGEDGKLYFIEVNPRIQVEHPVTEETTTVDGKAGVDIVAAMIGIGQGMTLAQLGISQEKIASSGVSLEMRIVCEPGFVSRAIFPQSRDAVRVERGVETGMELPNSVDPMVAKVIVTGKDLESARQLALSVLQEIDIRGVRTNLERLEGILEHPKFAEGTFHTELLDTLPLPAFSSRVSTETRAVSGATRFFSELASGISGFFRHVGAKLQALPSTCEAPRLPKVSLEDASPAVNHRKTILDIAAQGGGDEAIRQRLFAEFSGRRLVTDTTFRDAQQSYVATRVRTEDLQAVGPHMARYLGDTCFSMETAGGATFDVGYRFLQESPFERNRQLDRAMPNVPKQMLLRGSNGLGYKQYDATFLSETCKKFKETGVDIFRVFDASNDRESLAVGMQAIRSAGGVIEAAISYTGIQEGERLDSYGNTHPAKFTLQYYLGLADYLISQGAHILAIKDMAGLLTEQDASKLISQIRAKHPQVLIHIHMHDTSGKAAQVYDAAFKAGANIVDVAMDPFGGLTSQPKLSEVEVSCGLAVFKGSDNARQARLELNQYFSDLQGLYRPFSVPGLDTVCGEAVYDHQAPGGQLTNLFGQAGELGKDFLFADVLAAYEVANQIFGGPWGIIKVTPTSKAVGDLAIALCQIGYRKEGAAWTVREAVERLVGSPDKIPGSTIEFLTGQMGNPGIYYEPCRTQILTAKNIALDAKGQAIPEYNEAAVMHELQEKFPGITFSQEDCIGYTMFPLEFEAFVKGRVAFGDLSSLPTHAFFNGLTPGKEYTFFGSKVVLDSVETISDTHKRVKFLVDGKDYVVDVCKSLNVKADPNNPAHVAAQLAGKVISYKDGLLQLEAMKMVTSFEVGKGDLVIPVGTLVQEGDLLFVKAEG